MTIKYHTIQTPPCLQGEISKEKSETRQSDNMDIKETIARFFRDGGIIPTQQGAQDLSADEKEALFDSVSEQDLIDADLTEQSQFVKEIQDNINSARPKIKTYDSVVDEKKEEVKEEPTKSAEKAD